MRPSDSSDCSPLYTPLTWREILNDSIFKIVTDDTALLYKPYYDCAPFKGQPLSLYSGRRLQTSLREMQLRHINYGGALQPFSKS